MNDDFYRTPMGRKFFDATMPKIAEELARLNANVAALVEELRRARESKPTE